MTVAVALDTHATIGESVTWVATEGALYWIDVKAPALHRFSPADGATRTWSLTSDVGGFALTDDGDAIVALREGIHRLDIETGILHLLSPPPFDPALFRFNEGACDSQGRFWIGVMFDPLEGSLPEQAGSLYRFTLAEGLCREADAAELHNGMAWSADGDTFYLSHSNSGTIFAFDYDAVQGRLSNRCVFATIPAADGIPDGAAIDTEGGYWCALHGGGAVRRFHADGSVDRDVSLPVSQPTMPAFAGENLATLYVTTARDKMTVAQKAAEPLAGALLSLDVGARGIARHYLVR